jgi:hypothetical protein
MLQFPGKELVRNVSRNRQKNFRVNNAYPTINAKVASEIILTALCIKTGESFFMRRP